MQRPPFPLKEYTDLYKIENHIDDYHDTPSEMIYSSCSGKKPLISIVIPLYKSDLFEKAFISACNQTIKKDYEVLVIDDFPTVQENVLPFIKENAGTNVRYLRNKKNLGLFGNWNRCIELALGEFIVFLHSDDALVPETLERLWEEHEKHGGATGVIGRYQGVDKDGSIIYSENSKRVKGLFTAGESYKIDKIGVLFGDLCNGCASLLNRNALLEIGGYNPNMFPLSDRTVMMIYAERYGLYRINKLVREETSFMSESNLCYTVYPACAFYMREAVIKRYHLNKWLWGLYSKHAYINQLNSYSGFKGDDPDKKPPFVSHLITRFFESLYRLRDIKIF